MALAGIGQLQVEPDEPRWRVTPNADDGDTGAASSRGESVKRKRTQSPAAIERSLEDSELAVSHEGHTVDDSIPVTDGDHRNENVTPNANNSNIAGGQNINESIESRFANIEKMLTHQQELLQKLVAAQEPPPPPLPSPSDIYERAREEAEFVDFHHWDSLYIHGLVRINGSVSHSVPKDPPCESCKAYNRVCIVLSEDDPYREFLFTERNVCCGWCEYATIPSEQQQYASRNWEAHRLEQEQDDSSSGVMDFQKPMKDKRPEDSDAKRMTSFFIIGEGIDKDVIHYEINSYLGNDAVVFPGTLKDPKTSAVTPGYYITAYRAPTHAMLEDIRAESAALQAWKLNEQRVSRSVYNEGNQQPTQSLKVVPSDDEVDFPVSGPWLQYAYGPSTNYCYLSSGIYQNYGYGISHRMSAIGSAPTDPRKSPRLYQSDDIIEDPNTIEEWIHTVGPVPNDGRISMSP